MRFVLNHNAVSIDSLSDSMLLTLSFCTFRRAKNTQFSYNRQAVKT